MASRTRTLVLFLAMLGCGPASSTTSSTNASSMGSESSSSSDSSGTGDTQSTDTETSGDCPPSGCLDQPPGACDPFAQDCPSGEKCVPHPAGFWYDSECFPIVGDAAAGEPCSYGLAFDDCDATSVCLGGICQPLCTGDEQMPSCPPGYECSLPDYGPPLCVQPCHPLTEPCAAPELDCVWTDALFGCVGADGQAPPGEYCSLFNDCASGVCVGWDVEGNCPFDAGGCCAVFCALSAGAGPCQAIAPNFVCASFSDELPPGYEDVGVCVSGP